MAMRLGTENKAKRWIAIIGGSIALTLFAHMVWNLASGPSVPPPPTAQTSTTVPAAARRAGSSGHAAQRLQSAAALDPTLHPERMARAENTTYTGTSRDIFSKDSLPPAAVAAIETPVASVRTGPTAPAGPPPPPAVDLKFYGFATASGGRKLVFLSHNDDVFIAGEGDVVQGRYKIVKIDTNSVTVDDLAYNDNQTLTLQTI